MRNRAVLLALIAMACVQTGAGVSTWLFDRFSPVGTAWLRLCWAAVGLVIVARPRVRGRTRTEWLGAISLGTASGMLTALYFQAVARIPLGTATALEFLGPLSVAFMGLRRRWDAIWPLAAVGGVIILTRPWTGTVNMSGVAYALGAAAGWACYIVLTQRVGDRFTGFSGLAVSMVSAAVVTAPFADVPTVMSNLDGPALIVSAGAALLLPVVPYACEMVALRSLTTASFGTLMSLEPAIGTMVGLVLLAQQLTWSQLVGIALVTVAGIGAIHNGARSVSRVAQP